MDFDLKSVFNSRIALAKVFLGVLSLLVILWLVFGPLIAESSVDLISQSQNKEQCSKVVKDYSMCKNSYHAVNEKYKLFYQVLHHPEKLEYSLNGFGRPGPMCAAPLYEIKINVENSKCGISKVSNRPDLR